MGVDAPRLLGGESRRFRDDARDAGAAGGPAGTAPNQFLGEVWVNERG